jgi:hypothetical protein
MGYANIVALIFDGQNYAFSNKRMQKKLQEHKFDSWHPVVDGYAVPSTPPTNKDGDKIDENKSKAKATILSSLDDLVFVKVMH